MKLVCVIAIILAILFGFSVAASFLAALWIGAIVLLVVTAIYMAVTQLREVKIGSAIFWAAVAAVFGGLLSICS